MIVGNHASDMSLPCSPKALDAALQSISETAFRPGRDHSVYLTVPPPSPSLCLNAPLASSHSYSSFSDLGLHSPEDGSQSKEMWGFADNDGPLGIDLESAQDNQSKTPMGSDRFDLDDFCDEQSWIQVDASSPEVSPIFDGANVRSTSIPLPPRIRFLTNSLALPSPFVLPSPLLPLSTPEGLGVHIVDTEDSEIIEHAPLLRYAAPMGLSWHIPLSFSDRVSNRKSPPPSLNLGHLSNDWETRVTLDAFERKDGGAGAVIKSRTKRLHMIRSTGERAWLRSATRIPLPLGNDKDLWEHYDQPVSFWLWSRISFGTGVLRDAFNEAVSSLGDIYE